MDSHGAHPTEPNLACNSTDVLYPQIPTDLFTVRQADSNRHGNAPAYIHSTGSLHAPLWAAQCLDCFIVLPLRPRLSGTLADLAWHQEMHRVWRSELRNDGPKFAGVSRSQNSGILSDPFSKVDLMDVAS